MIGLALSGGGSRAIAFHLGCLRALNDKGILDKINVISTVSGGSIIGAMYAYSDCPFEEFEGKIIKILKKGLVFKILRNLVFSPLLFQIPTTMIISGLSALSANSLRFLLSNITILLGKENRGRYSFVDRIQPPFRRWYSRTDSLVKTLTEDVFGSTIITEVKRNNMDVVINACELRTGSAFRFGNRESGCWRFGQLLKNNVTVAEAVSASAAYPVFLPALDRKYKFLKSNSSEVEERIILTDGGVYDNFGITCFDPEKSPDYSYNVYNPDYIISCDAGHGIFSDHVRPYWWSSRMTRTFESVFRKNNDNIKKQFFSYLESGKIKGFILPYLGQLDDSLPFVPDDLVKREEVINYPTDFSAMSEYNIELLSKRGEQLTQLLLDCYLPDL